MVVAPWILTQTSMQYSTYAPKHRSSVVILEHVYISWISPVLDVRVV